MIQVYVKVKWGFSRTDLWSQDLGGILLKQGMTVRGLITEVGLAEHNLKRITVNRAPEEAGAVLKAGDFVVIECLPTLCALFGHGAGSGSNKDLDLVTGGVRKFEV